MVMVRPAHSAFNSPVWPEESKQLLGWVTAIYTRLNKAASPSVASISDTSPMVPGTCCALLDLVMPSSAYPGC